MGWRCRVPGHIHPAGCPLLPGTSLWITAEQDGEAAAGAMLAMVCARIACFLCILSGCVNCTDLRRTCLSSLRSARCRRQTLRQRMFVVSPNNYPVVDVGRCTGCGWCVAACPEHVLALEPQGWRKTSVLLDANACTGCRKCEVRCPFRVISMVRRPLRGS